MAYSKIKLATHPPPPPPPPVNFSNTSRGPIVKCYTFLETSHDQLQELQVMSNFFLKIKITQPLPSRKDLNQVQAFPRFLFITQPLQLKIDILGYVSSLPHCFRLSQPLQSKN